MVTISPEPFIEKCRSLAKARDIHVEVVGRRIRLAWIKSSDGHIDFMERVDAIGLGISYDMLLEALQDDGGAIGSDGHYPINNVIWQVLRNFFRT